MPGLPKPPRKKRKPPKAPNYLGTIRTRKTKSGIRYYAEVMINGSMIYGPRVDSPEQARPALQQKLAEMAQKQRQAENPSENLSTLVPTYLNGRNTKHRAENTNDLANYAWKAVEPTLGHLTPSDISPELFHAAFAALPIAGDTKNRYQREVAAALHHFGCLIKTTRFPKSPTPDITVLDRKKQKLLLQTARHPRTQLAIQILLETGIRPAEACGLMHEDRFDDGIWIVRSRTMVKGRPTNKAPKTEQSKAWVPISSELQKKIGPPKQGFVLALGGIPWNTTNLRRAVRTVAIEAGLEAVNPNELRHTAAVNMLAAGVDPATVASITRHSMTTLLKLYYRGSNDLKRQALKKTQKYVGS